VVLGVVAGSPLAVLLAPPAEVGVVGAPYPEVGGQPLAPFRLELVRLHRHGTVYHHPVQNHVQDSEVQAASV
jgi:hypothetical protein